MRRAVALLLSVAPCSCRCDEGPALVPAGKGGQSATRTSASAASTGNNVPEPASTPADRPGDPPPGSLFPEAEPHIRALQAALVARDKAQFASLLVYPVRVNTHSGCAAMVPDQASFVNHFDTIVTPKIRGAILSAQPPFRAGAKGLPLKDASVWIQRGEANKPFVLALNSETWSVPGLPCHSETPQPVPGWLHGTWKMVSVSSWRPFGNAKDLIGRTIRIDTKARTIDLTAFPGRNRCRIERFVQHDPLPPSWGVFVGLYERSLYGDCLNPSGRRTAEVLDVLDHLLVYGSGMNPYYHFRKIDRTSRAARIAKEREKCGQTDVHCAPGLLCVAQSARGAPMGAVETCEPAESDGG